MIEFEAFPKIPRLNKSMVVTEKIDGTNAAVIITEDGEVGAQSRKRLIYPGQDNFGFAAWVHEHADALRDQLGPGRHFGEWWGKGVQRGYGLDHKRFSLFNTHRWNYAEVIGSGIPGLDVVPELYRGQFSEEAIDSAITHLRRYGSIAAPTYMQPEGIVVFLNSSRSMFKVMCENDDVPKGAVA